MNDNYEQLACEILEEICGTDEIKDDPDMDLFEMGLIDSLSTINIILSIEEKTGIKLQPTDFERKDISTLKNFRAFLKGKGQ